MVKPNDLHRVKLKAAIHAIDDARSTEDLDIIRWAIGKALNYLQEVMLELSREKR
jgi:hypothetical protein